MAELKLKKNVAAALQRADVGCIDIAKFQLKCNCCGQVWSPNILSGGRLPRGYWKCPTGCNFEKNLQG